MIKELYPSEAYLKNNPSWHSKDSYWKAKQIIKIIKKNNQTYDSICEVGCGAGEILIQLQKSMHKKCDFRGYEISPAAYKICKEKENEKINFKFKDILLEENVTFELMLIIDVIEHLEDYANFLEKTKTKSKHKIFHIPLEMNALSILRKQALLTKRKKVGHIHFFTKELAIQTLKDCGYEILDYFYTAGGVELKSKSIRNNLLRLPRKILFAINKDFCVRLLGGYSLLVLAK
ncbi:methyltransferase domain-containing protein [Candidatus Woesearchaeota archaeon]|jgi:hypothetical protein|nr:methyltransferase domain-containing protein [Candidatus Woesearchaeota archaeon]MBT4368029.1 methyltransferase domain-containing protein [Candidatus Woesearchaeota archaeon]MBT4712517.1 methyltransferase domain-containing protein [Candidatus Woesearchaeota archaeon]MBT6639430.1 methyltransferase domain-containing protein [Candidatus Woesearchaeota archaeon]MBT7133602.1 methyltransferase domain-containing protein [Candidatus Woesearchaeota archaeon]